MEQENKNLPTKGFISSLFDYNYYRVAEFYLKREGTDAVTARIHICLIITFCIMPFFLLGIYWTSNDNNLQYNGKILARIVLPVFSIILYIIVTKRYKGKYKYLKDKWRNQNKQKRVIGGWAVILSLLVPILISILVAVKRSEIISFLHNS